MTIPMYPFLIGTIFLRPLLCTLFCRCEVIKYIPKYCGWHRKYLHSIDGYYRAILSHSSFLHENHLPAVNIYSPHISPSVIRMEFKL